MPANLQQNLDSVDRKTEHSLQSGSTEWLMKGIPKLPQISEERIVETLKPGVLLRPTRNLSDAEAVEVVERSYKQFTDDSLFSPLAFVFRNPTKPVTSDEDRPTLHPIAFTVVMMLVLFGLLSFIVWNL